MRRIWLHSIELYPTPHLSTCYSTLPYHFPSKPPHPRTLATQRNAPPPHLTPRPPVPPEAMSTTQTGSTLPYPIRPHYTLPLPHNDTLSNPHIHFGCDCLIRDATPSVTWPIDIVVWLGGFFCSLPQWEIRIDFSISRGAKQAPAVEGELPY